MSDLSQVSANAKRTGLLKNIIDDLLKKIKDQVGDNKVLLGLSGGVDSSVVAALTSPGNRQSTQLTCVFVEVMAENIKS